MLVVLFLAPMGFRAPSMEKLKKLVPSAGEDCSRRARAREPRRATRGGFMII